MTDRSYKLAKWPFLVGDILLVAAAVFVVWQRPPPVSPAEMLLCTALVALGALLCVTPFVLEYRALVRLSEAETLAGTLKQLQNLEAVAKSVSAATAQWHGIQDLSEQTARATKEVAERMAAEAAAFREFLQKANDSEKATLRLEAEKLHRAQAEWLQIVVHMLDHVYALHKAAVRSGKPEVMAQIASFQNACRDIARRVGLVPFEAAADETFDPARHQLMDGKTAPQGGARISDTLACGYTFQGKLIRPAVVAIKSDNQETGHGKAGSGDASSAQPVEQALL